MQQRHAKAMTRMSATAHRHPQTQLNISRFLIILLGPPRVIWSCRNCIVLSVSNMTDAMNAVCGVLGRRIFLYSLTPYEYHQMHITTRRFGVEAFDERSLRGRRAGHLRNGRRLCQQSRNLSCRHLKAEC